MKTSTLLSQSLLIIFLLFNLTTITAQDNSLDFLEFVRDEATYRNQQIVIRRSSFEHPVTLREQLNEILGIQTFDKAYVVQSHKNGMEYSTYENVNELLDKDPIFLSYTKDGNTLKRKQFEMNTSIYLCYKNKNNKESCLIVHNRHRGFLNKSIYTRTSIMMPSDNDTDDYRSFHSNSSPLVVSYLTAFDTKDMSEEMLKFEDVLTSTLEKHQNGKDMTDLENQCLIGLKENDNTNYNYGEWLFENNMFHDSYITLKPILEMLKPHIKSKEGDLSILFDDISHKMGISMWKQGFYDTAEYYLGLAADRNDEYKSDYQNFIQSRTYQAPITLGDPTSALPIGQVLSILFDVKESQVKKAIYSTKEQKTTLDNNSAIWEFDIKQLCTPEPSNITVTYSRTHIENNDKDSVDKSILCYENNIIISSVKTDEKRWRMNILIPNFRNFDYKNAKDRYNIPSYASFIIGTEEYEIETNKKKNKLFDSLDSRMKTVKDLVEERRFMESLTLLMQMNHEIYSQPEKDRLKDKIKELHSIVLYDIGYQLSELELSIKGIPYLNKSLALNDTRNVRAEYISVLSNIVDPRALDLIRAELAKSDLDKSFESLMNRRYVYLLIEYKMLDEAEVILKKLLDDPESSTFARNELEYLKSLREKQ